VTLLQVDIVYPVNALAFHPKWGTFVTGGSDGESSPDPIAQPTIAAARAPPHCAPLLQHDSRTVTRVCADMPMRLRAQRELFRLRMIRRARSGYAADCMECQRVGQGQQEADRSLCVRDVGRFARL
jgi:hypothetical protein